MLDIDDTPVPGKPGDTSQRIEAAVAAGVRRATGKQAQINLRGGVSLGNWIAIVGLVLGCLTAAGAVAREVFFSAASGAALQSTVTAQDRTLTKIEDKLGKIEGKLDEALKVRP